MTAPGTSSHQPVAEPHEGGEVSHSAESPALHYLLALITSALVVGLSFFVKEERTRWICVAVGIVMVISVLIAFAKEMGGSRRRG